MKHISPWIAVALLAAGLAETHAAERPNIIFVMADDLGYAHLGCYGQQIIATPNLDRMAAEGLRFTDFYAGCCVCAPSRSVLMTGLHGGHTPVRGNTGGIPLDDDDVTVAELLKAAGYSTGVCGKWGLGEHGTSGVPYRQGFDEFFGYLHQIHAHFQFPPYLWRNDRKLELPGNREGARGQYAQDEITSEALEFVRRHREGPFFLYLAFAVPHYELLVPDESLREYAGQFTETPYAGAGNPPGYPNGYAPQAMPRAAMAAIVAHLDRSVGRLLALLKELELDEQTLVLFTSDNGAASGASDPEFFGACGPFRGAKGTMWEGGLRTPMIARWPGTIAAGGVNDEPWYFADVLPTLAELAGAEVPQQIDGISLAKVLVDQPPAADPRQRVLYWELGPARAVRRDRWKAIRTRPQAPVELYDLHADAGETTNLAASQPEIASQMESLLESEHTEPRPQIEPEKPAGRRFQ